MSNAGQFSGSEIEGLRDQVQQLKQEVAELQRQQQASTAERQLLMRLLELHERDRQLIGFEIHDGIVQDMTAAVMYLEAAHRDIESFGEAPDSLLAGTKLLRDSIHEARRLISGLQPPVLNEAGLTAALQSLAHDLGEKSGVVLTLSLDPQLENLPPPVEMAVFRIVQEGLNNIWQHSQARTAEVKITLRDGLVTIEICDDGIGFDPARVKKKRYGLSGIRERARLFGGQSVIQSAPGRGTTIHAELPAIFNLPRNDEVKS